MERSDRDLQIVKAFNTLGMGHVTIQDHGYDTLYVYANHKDLYIIELPSDDDGFFYAYPCVGGTVQTNVCIRIPYP